MRKINRFEVKVIVAGLFVVVLIFIVKYLPYIFALLYAREPASPEYYQYVQNRLTFSTIACNAPQWDTIHRRINAFFYQNPQYVPHDSIAISVTKCMGGCSYTNKLIYFESEPIEVYEVHFDMSPPNYIDKVYNLEQNSFVEYETMNLDSIEKKRIKDRIKSDILNRIDWSF